MLNTHPIVGVMGSHEKPWEELAGPLGKLLAQRGCHLLTGAGSGAMTAVAKAYTETAGRAGLSIGIIPTVEKDGVFTRSGSEYTNPYVEIPIVTPLDVKALSDRMPYSRNHVNIMSSHAVVILPGEHGTRHETELALMMKKPHVLFGPEKAFLQFPEEAVRVQAIEQVRDFIDEFLKFFDGRYIFERVP